jgi:hypothetical protein
MSPLPARFVSRAAPGEYPTMRGRFEFTFHLVAEADALVGDVDPSLALLGSQGWEIRGVAALSSGVLSVALQRPYDEANPLPDAPALSARLAEPLAAPSAGDLEREPSL